MNFVLFLNGDLPESLLNRQEVSYFTYIYCMQIGVYVHACELKYAIIILFITNWTAHIRSFESN
jgi:hypothetical protein